MDETLDGLLAAAAKTPAAAMRAGYVMADLEKLAPIFADAEARPVAEATIEQWQDGTLRKRLGNAWLAHAHARMAGIPTEVPAGNEQPAEDPAALSASTDTPGAEHFAHAAQNFDSHVAAANGVDQAAVAAESQIEGAKSRSAEIARHGRTMARWGFKAGLAAGQAMGKSNDFIAPPQKHNSSGFWGAVNGAIGGSQIGGAAGLIAGARSGHMGAVAAGAVAGAGLGAFGGFMAHHREAVEDSGYRPGAVTRTLGAIGRIPRAIGRLNTANAVMPAFGTLHAIGMEHTDSNVRHAQNMHRTEVQSLNAQHASGQLSEKEHAERIAAAHARWAK